jgi:uncharacterized cupin superfamily protein
LVGAELGIRVKLEIRKPQPHEEAEALSWAVWSCEASSFEWGYEDTETCLILDGEAMVEAAGKEWRFGKGDWVVFPKGLACRWNVIKPVTKRYKFGTQTS